MVHQYPLLARQAIWSRVRISDLKLGGIRSSSKAQQNAGQARNGGMFTVNKIGLSC
jgi:hypothetical protein